MEKPEGAEFLTGSDVREQFALFMSEDGHRYPDEHDPDLMAYVAQFSPVNP